MKNSSHGVFIKLMYWFFKIVFWLQLAIVALLLILNYFMYNNEQGLHFTVRGNIYAHHTTSKSNSDLSTLDSDSNIPSNPNSSSNKYGVETQNTIGRKTIYFLSGQRIGFMRIDYSDFSKAFTIKNIAWTLTDISILLLWLLITYQIMKILQSMKKQSIFILKNIKRITFIGWAFILIPFIEIGRDHLFFLIAGRHFEIQGYNLISNFNWYDLLPLSLYGSTSLGTFDQARFPSIALGLIILVIVQIFKNGFELQKEQDLTI